VGKIYVAAVIVMMTIIMMPAPNCRGIRCVCAEGKTKMFTGFDDVCENLSYE
jgi:hypothetical protein